MKTRSILPFAVLGFLLVVLFASSCGGGDGFSGDEFGGPYPLALTLEETIEKKLDFECYRENDLSLSEAVELNADLLKDSIEKNDAFPHGTDMQKYNFVIDGKGEIIVAKWKDIDLEGAMANADIRCQGRRCEELGGISLEEYLKGIMVNLYPEDDDATPKQSPCWLDRESKDKGPGLLDAISKHLMLAQGKDTTIAEFKWTDWMVADVAYAGEIVVDLGNCAYWVNGNSGTYKPDEDTMRARAQQHFAKRLPIDEILSEVPELCP